MNQLLVGKFITQKRKEKNLTQEQLAEKIGVSNKTISKWETGKCMPDYSVIELLCEELKITLAELMNGEEDEKSIHTYDNEQIVEMLKEIQNLKAKKKLIIGFILLVMGGVMLTLSQICGGTDIQDFLSVVMLGLSIGEFLAGFFLLAYYLAYKDKRSEVTIHAFKTNYGYYWNHIFNNRAYLHFCLHFPVRQQSIVGIWLNV